MDATHSRQRMRWTRGLGTLLGGALLLGVLAPAAAALTTAALLDSLPVGARDTLRRYKDRSVW